jgi:hypothetical protein
MKREGTAARNIARTFNISEATVYNIASGRTRGRSEGRKKLVLHLPEPGIQEEDLSKRGDDEFFQHVRPWDFIG